MTETLNTLRAALMPMDDDGAADLARVRALKFGNLTAPILRQMKGRGQVWASLSHIASTMTATTPGSRGMPHLGEWGPGCEAGIVEMTVNPSASIRTVLRIRQGPEGWRAIGPDKLSGRFLDIDTHLPETVIAACAGRAIGEIVDEDLARVIGADVVIKRAEATRWGMRIILDLPLIQPTDEEITAIRAALTAID